MSLPLDRRGWFAGDVVGDAGDAGDFVDDAAGDEVEEVVGQVRPAGGHEVDGFHGPQGNNVVVAASVAHDADRLDRQEDGKGLAGLVVEVVPVEFLDKDGVGLA